MTPKQLGRRQAVRRSPVKAEMVISEGVIATPQALRRAHAQHLPAWVLAEVGGLDSEAGIFVLTARQYENLRRAAGGFTAAEQEHLRPVVNTRDVFPYGR